MIRYVVHPGWVRSRNDGQDHFIRAGRLIHLYRVNPRECIIVPYPHTLADLDRALIIERTLPPDVEHLYPRYDGHYCGVDDHPPGCRC